MLLVPHVRLVRLCRARLRHAARHACTVALLRDLNEVVERCIGREQPSHGAAHAHHAAAHVRVRTRRVRARRIRLTAGEHTAQRDVVTCLARGPPAAAARLEAVAHVPATPLYVPDVGGSILAARTPNFSKHGVQAVHVHEGVVVGLAVEIVARMHAHRAQPERSRFLGHLANVRQPLAAVNKLQVARFETFLLEQLGRLRLSNLLLLPAQPPGWHIEFVAQDELDIEARACPIEQCTPFTPLHAKARVERRAHDAQEDAYIGASRARVEHRRRPFTCASNGLRPRTHEQRCRSEAQRESASSRWTGGE